MRKSLLTLAALATLTTAAQLPAATTAVAEDRTYGRISLTGLARNSWHLNAPGPQAAMVCNVNGPDGWLAIRSGPGNGFKANRKLKRLAVVEIDTSQRQGRWVRVLTAFRDHTTSGRPQAFRKLNVVGWAHDGYLCDFLD